MNFETLDQNNMGSEPKPANFNILSVLSYLGNLFWIALIMYYYTIMNEVLSLIPIPDGVAAAQVEQIFLMLFGILIFTCMLSLIGVILMNKRKKVGFFIYAVGNGLFGLLMFVGGTSGSPMSILFGVTCFFFIYLYSRHLKWLA